MDENMVISSSSSSCSLMSQPPLQQRLQFLLQSQPPHYHWWNYAIFWRTTTHHHPNSPSLVWGDGHFHGFKTPSSEPISRPNHIHHHDEPISSIDDVDTDAEWFYMTSPPQSYPTHGNGILPKCFTTGSLVWLTGPDSIGFYSCHRVKEAQAHGLQTLVCIPVSNGVLELGSLDLIDEYWALVHQARSLLGQSGPDFDSDGPVTSHVAAPKKTGKRRCDGPRVAGSHVEAERQRRDKMNRRFYELRSVVPKVSKMDKASLLADAVAYINDLKGKIVNLESQMESQSGSPTNKEDRMVNREEERMMTISKGGLNSVEVVKIMGNQVLIRVQTQNVNHPSARLMSVLKDLDFQVYHASVSTVQDLMLQDVVILNVPQHLNHDHIIKATILKRLDMIM